MKMINLLQRLAELDAANPRVKKMMTQENSLATVGNVGGQQGVAEATDNSELRDAVLSVLQNILQGAQDGHDMIDDVADELGDYFDDVKNSDDETLKKAYAFAREHGAEAEDNPEAMVRAMKMAISQLQTGQTDFEGVAEEVENDPYHGLPDDEKNKIDQAVYNAITTFAKGKEPSNISDDDLGDIDFYIKDHKLGFPKDTLDTIEVKGVDLMQILQDVYNQWMDGPYKPRHGRGSINQKGVAFGQVQQGLAEGLNECGPMGMPGQPHSPASINMTAASGDELSSMLKDILSLAGLQKVEPEHLGHEMPPVTVSPVPTIGVGPMSAEPMTAEPIETDSESMRSVLDKLHPEEETDESYDKMYDTSPADPRDAPAFDSEEFAHHENQPGSGDDEEGEKRQTNLPTATYENLMAEYRKFINE